MFMAAFAKPLLCAGRFISTKFNLKTMSKNEIAFAIFYGAISIAGFCVAIHYWYYELYKKRQK
jgi:hypothetical protein